MNRGVAFPFLTLSDAAVEAEPWSLSLNGGSWQPAGDFLPDWDSASVIRIRRTLKVDPSIAADDLGIAPEDLALSLGLRVGTGPGRLPRLVVFRSRRELAADTWQDEFDVEVEGEPLSLVLDIQTQITLTTPARGRNQLSPQRIADRLWSDTLRVRLEGEEPRFPIEIADFPVLLGTATAASAPWYLHWSPRDWNRDFHGAARLFLNEEQTAFIERVNEQDGPMLQVMLAEVMGQICERLVFDPEADELVAGAEPGSLGAQAVSWLQKAWPDRDLAFVRSVAENRPGMFRAAFLALAELRDL